MPASTLPLSCVSALSLREQLATRRDEGEKEHHDPEDGKDDVDGDEDRFTAVDWKSWMALSMTAMKYMKDRFDDRWPRGLQAEGPVHVVGGEPQQLPPRQA
jgi:hypothetical protein